MNFTCIPMGASHSVGLLLNLCWYITSDLYIINTIMQVIYLMKCSIIICFLAYVLDQIPPISQNSSFLAFKNKSQDLYISHPKWNHRNNYTNLKVSLFWIWFSFLSHIIWRSFTKMQSSYSNFGYLWINKFYPKIQQKQFAEKW